MASTRPTEPMIPAQMAAQTTGSYFFELDQKLFELAVPTIYRLDMDHPMHLPTPVHPLMCHTELGRRVPVVALKYRRQALTLIALQTAAHNCVRCPRTC